MLWHCSCREERPAQYVTVFTKGSVLEQVGVWTVYRRLLLASGFRRKSTGWQGVTTPVCPPCVWMCVWVSPSLIAAKFMLTYFFLGAAVALSNLIYITWKEILAFLVNMSPYICFKKWLCNEVFVIKYAKLYSNSQGVF